jgi:PPOX class probable F420-dependent enzyme
MANRENLNEAELAFVLRQRVGRLATADEDGTPYLVPICFACDSAHFYTPLDEKPKNVPVTQLRRVRNIETHHAATLLIDQYADDWSQLGYVLIQAQAQLLPPSAALHSAALQLLRARYTQYKTMALELYPVIMLTPRRVTSWGPAIQHMDPSE